MLVKSSQSIGGQLIKRLDKDLIFWIGFLWWKNYDHVQIAKCLNIAPSTFSRWTITARRSHKQTMEEQSWYTYQYSNDPNIRALGKELYNAEKFRRIDEKRLRYHRLDKEWEEQTRGKTKHTIMKMAFGFKPRRPRTSGVNPNRDRITGRFTSYPKVGFYASEIIKSLDLGGSSVEPEEEGERFPDYEPDESDNRGFGVW
jgi:hypothetical protein